MVLRQASAAANASHNSALRPRLVPSQVARPAGGREPQMLSDGKRLGRNLVELAQLAAHALAGLAELALELGEFAGAVLDELELAVDVAEGLLEQRAAALGVDVVAAQLGAHRGAGLLGGEQRLELLERDAEQALEAHHLAQALDLGLGVGAVLPGWPRGDLGQQADLLVVADRARCGADEPRDVADAQWLDGGGRLGIVRAGALATGPGGAGRAPPRRRRARWREGACRLCSGGPGRHGQRVGSVWRLGSHTLT